MSTIGSPKYPNQIAVLLQEEPPSSSHSALEAFDFASAVAPQVVRDVAMASACESGLWLRHHDLDRSHDISQQIDTPTGSYWHGIMHRLEGDFGNAKYWFRRVGTHPIFPHLAAAAHQITPDNFLSRSDWDPFGFIDRCEAIAQQSATDIALQRVASAEWDLLFEYCFRQALGLD